MIAEPTHNLNPKPALPCAQGALPFFPLGSFAVFKQMQAALLLSLALLVANDLEGRTHCLKDCILTAKQRHMSSND
eukprot:scaffold55763_cov27-Tisochrysis_lutea.AAC.1